MCFNLQQLNEKKIIKFYVIIRVVKIVLWQIKYILYNVSHIKFILASNINGLTQMFWFSQNWI